MSLPMRVAFLGDPHEREVKRHREVVKRISDLEPEIEKLSDAELSAKTQEFRDRLGVEGPDLGLGQPVSASLVVTGGGDADAEAADRRSEREDHERDLDDKLSDILPEAFAVVREA